MISSEAKVRVWRSCPEGQRGSPVSTGAESAENPVTPLAYVITAQTAEMMDGAVIKHTGPEGSWIRPLIITHESLFS